MDKAQAKNILQQGNYFLYRDISNCIIMVGKVASQSVDIWICIYLQCAWLDFSYELTTAAFFKRELGAGLHLVFTREVLEEIPTASLAITNLRVTSYSTKKGGEEGGGVDGWRGEGSVKTCKEEREKEKKESERAALCNRLSQANFP